MILRKEKEREPENWRRKLPAFAVVMMTNLLQKHWEWQEEWNPLLRHGNAVTPIMYLANLDIKTVSDETKPKHVAKFLDNHATHGWCIAVFLLEM